MGQTPPRKFSRRRMWITLSACAVLLACFILCCSGLNIPLLSPQGNLTAMLRDDWKMAPPPSLRVLHGARTAYRDPAKHFVCQLDPKDFAVLEAALTSTAARLGYKVSDPDALDQRVSFGPPPPEWYDVASFPDRIPLKYHLSRDVEETSYWFFYVPSAQKLYIFWCAY